MQAHALPEDPRVSACGLPWGLGGALQAWHSLPPPCEPREGQAVGIDGGGDTPLCVSGSQTISINPQESSGLGIL